MNQKTDGIFVFFKERAFGDIYICLSKYLSKWVKSCSKVGVTVGKKEQNQMSDYEPDIDEVS